MANVKFTEFPSAATVGSTDIIPIVQGGTNKKATAAVFSTYIGSAFVALTGNQTIAGVKTFSSQLASTVATGTAPFSIASTTKVTNLNADLLDGLSSADFQLTLTNPITGTGTTNYLPKFTGASALGNSLIYDNGTSVGIGTAAPATKFQVDGGRTSLFSGDAYSLILAQTAAQTNIVYLGTQADGTFNISNNAGNPQLTLLQSGNLGLGTTTPAVKLESKISTSGLPVTSGTTQTNGALRISSSATTGILDFGINGANNWIQSTDAGDLSQGYNLLLNPRGGNVLIGTTTDAGYKLNVNGTGRVFGTSAGLTIQSTSAGQNAELFFTSTATTWRVGQNIGTATDFEIYNGGTLFKMATSGAATFSGQVNIGNPVAAAVAVASTHKVTIVIGGTTYYLLATT